jgi:hypothetical protein
MQCLQQAQRNYEYGVQVKVLSGTTVNKKSHLRGFHEQNTHILSVLPLVKLPTTTQMLGLPFQNIWLASGAPASPST